MHTFVHVPDSSIILMGFGGFLSQVPVKINAVKVKAILNIPVIKIISCFKKKLQSNLRGCNHVYMY